MSCRSGQFSDLLQLSRFARIIPPLTQDHNLLRSDCWCKFFSVSRIAKQCNNYKVLIHVIPIDRPAACQSRSNGFFLLRGPKKKEMPVCPSICPSERMMTKQFLNRFQWREYLIWDGVQRWGWSRAEGQNVVTSTGARQITGV